MLGKAGLDEARFWRMTWNDYDTAMHHYELRQQQQMEGHRVVATLLYNAWFTNTNPKNGPIVKPKSPPELLALPLLDGPAKASPKATETPAQTWARLQAQGLL